jgi:hypothetical protein
MRARPKSGFYGVRADGKRWQARLRFGGKQHRLGTFDTKQEAALAYDWAARKHKGDKAQCNYDTIEAAEAAAAQATPGLTLARLQLLQPKPRPASGFYGVSANGKRWKARIRYGGKEHSLGTFDTKEEAALAYDRAVRAHTTERRAAVCNFDSALDDQDAPVPDTEASAKQKEDALSLVGMAQQFRGPSAAAAPQQRKRKAQHEPTVDL